MYFMKRGQKEITKENFEIFRERCDKNAIFVDERHLGTDDVDVPEEELLPGEISAFTFQVGCYTVRSAYRFYESYKQDGNYFEKPAGKDDVGMARKDLEWNSRSKGWFYKDSRSSI